MTGVQTCALPILMKNTGTFWRHGVDVPFLGGISRDTLPAEFSLYTMLYMILPAYPAYIAGYLLKIVIALLSCIWLAGDVLGEGYERYKPLVYLSGLAYTAMTVSSMMHGEYGIEDVCLSIPFIVGPDGICGKILPDLTQEEIEKLHNSANMLKSVIAQIEI